jgi:predicted O-methyltransferase YrrM
MKYTPNLTPKYYYEILEKSKKIHFEMYSQEDLGLLLRFLTASKKNPQVLELGTGTGLSLCWIIDALGKKGSVISIEKEQDYLKIAAGFFGNDPRVQLIHQDAHLWIQDNKGAQFDLVFADTWTGKFTDFEAVLAMVKPGGFYLVDDLNFQSDWPRSHQDKVIILMEKLKCREDFFSLSLDEGSGFMVLCKKQS